MHILQFLNSFYFNHYFTLYEKINTTGTCRLISIKNVHFLFSVERQTLMPELDCQRALMNDTDWISVMDQYHWPKQLSHRHYTEKFLG